MRRALVLVACVACGGGESPAPPGPVDPAPGYIVVHASGPEFVVFHDGNGTVLSSVQADLSGDAVGPMTACGAVTVFPDRSHLFTVTQVQPGDELDLRIPSPPTGGTARDVAIEFPTVAGATSYEFRKGRARDGCSCPATFASTSPALVTIEACCVARDDTTAITAIARGPSAFTYASLEKVSVPELTANRVSIGAWTTETTTIRLSVADLPVPSTALMDVTQFSGAIAMDSVAFTQVEAPGEVVLPRLGDHVVTGAEVTDPDTGTRNFVLRSDAAPLPSSFALAPADFAPQVTGVSVYDADPLRPIVSWTTSRPTTDETAIAVGVALFGGSWTIVAPSDQPGAIRYPELPDDFRRDMEVITASVDVIYTAATPAYSDAHRQPRALLAQPSRFHPPAATGVLHHLSRSGSLSR